MIETNTAGKNLGRLTESILIPLPDHDFDPTECAIPWKICNSRGGKVTFSTEHGNIAQADPHLLKGPILGPLGAGAKALAAYRQMTQDAAYQHRFLTLKLIPTDTRLSCYSAVMPPACVNTWKAWYCRIKCSGSGNRAS